jgi:hypothetical protein
VSAFVIGVSQKREPVGSEVQGSEFRVQPLGCAGTSEGKLKLELEL